MTRDSGLHSKDAPPEQSGGLLRQTYLCKGARCIATSAVLQGRCLYDGEIGEVFRYSIPEGDRPPASLPAFALARFPKYRGLLYLDGDPKVAPITPTDRLLDRRRRCSRIMIPLAPAWGVTYRKSHGATCGAGRDSERVVFHPSTPSFGKSHTGGIHTACSRAQSAGRGSYGEPLYAPSALYLHPLCSRDRILIRVANQITDGRERGTRRIEELAAATRDRRPNLLQEYGQLADRAKISIRPEEPAALFGPR